MSVKDLKDYGKRAGQDPAVRAKAKAIGMNNVKGQAEYAKTLGYQFDESDFAALAKEIAPKGELTDKDLGQIAGGIVTTVGAGAFTAVGSGSPYPPGTAVTAAGHMGGW